MERVIEYNKSYISDFNVNFSTVKTQWPNLE